ncbi:MAG: nucleotidyl transferase AbiEii/AbiGii toxin family protein [Myxococcota bacterium]
MESLTTDWSEFLGLLISEKVEFLLIGGHALAAHGHPRFTEDLDVFVRADEANARRVRSALEKFGFGDVAPEVSALTQVRKVFMLGRKPFRIDILTGISGVNFDEAWENRDYVELAPGSVPLISRVDLIKNKAASGRPKDLADLAALSA